MSKKQIFEKYLNKFEIKSGQPDDMQEMRGENKVCFWSVFQVY